MDRRYSSPRYKSAWSRGSGPGPSCGRPRARLWYAGPMLFPLPAHAGLGVFENDALCESARRGCWSAPREIAGLLGRCAFGDEPLHLRILEECRSCGPAASTSKMESKRARKSSAGGGVAGAKLARIHGAVGVANVFENRRQGFGRVQVVVQALVERPRRRRGRARPPARSTPSGYWSVSSRSLKLRSRSMAVAADFSPSKVKFSDLR